MFMFVRALRKSLMALSKEKDWDDWPSTGETAMNRLRLRIKIMLVPEVVIVILSILTSS